MKRSPSKAAIFGFSLFWVLNMAAFAALSPEELDKSTLAISKTLKPIPNDQWKLIAGERIQQKYEITSGDTLYDISKRLFGDSRYWPKIWALNNRTIFNPHVIHPGVKIAFLPGTGTALPGVRIEGDEEEETAETSSGANTSGGAVSGPYQSRLSRARSREWASLPTQPWEKDQIKVRRKPKHEISRDIRFAGQIKTLTREQPSVAASQKIKYLGQILGSVTPQEYLSPFDQVVITPYSDLEPGTTYAITRDPEQILDNEDEDLARKGYSYQILGSVKIIGYRDNKWIGVVTQVHDWVPRKTYLIPQPPMLQPLDPIAAEKPIHGKFYLDHKAAVFLTAQHHFGYVDLGTDDGLKEGMVLESVAHTDPTQNNKVIMKSDVFALTAMQVVQTSERYSLVYVFDGTREVEDGNDVRLATDVSRYSAHHIWDPIIPAPGEEAKPVPVAPEIPEKEEKLQEAAPPPAPAETAAPSPLPTEEAPPPEPSPEPSPSPEAAPLPAPVPAPAPSSNTEQEEDDLLTKKEKRELKQLEQWKQNPASPVPSPTSSAPAAEAPAPEAAPVAPAPIPSEAPAPTPAPTAATPPPPETAPAVEPGPIPPDTQATPAPTQQTQPATEPGSGGADWNPFPDESPKPAPTPTATPSALPPVRGELKAP